MPGAPSAGGTAEAAAGPADVQTLDFSQPTKFTTELRRRISAALEEAGESISAVLAGRLKAEVALELGETEQGSWAAARAGLAADAVAVAVQAGEHGHAMQLNIERSFTSAALECMLGGKAAQASADRHLSEIDWALAKDLLDVIVTELSSSWVELGGAELVRGELDTEGDAGVTVAPGEPTLSVALRATIDGCESAMWLLIPWDVASELHERSREQQDDAATEMPVATGIRAGLAVAQVLLRAEVGSAQMPIEQMLAIEPGTVVELGERAEEGVRLFAEEVSVGRGKPGRSGTRKAIKLLSTDAQPVHAAKYAKLGRGELERARAHAESDPERPRSPSILRSIFVRVWAELGRTHLALGEALELSPGSVVELDQSAEAPIELFGNGLCFARGRLVVTPEGSWGVSVEQLM